MNVVPGDALGRATITALLASNGMQAEQIFQLTMKVGLAVIAWSGRCKADVTETARIGRWTAEGVLHDRKR